METLGVAIAIGVLVLSLSAGLFIGGMRAASDPAFVGRTAIEIFKALAASGLFDRMKPEDEKRMIDVIRRGGQWDFARKRERVSGR